jgi:hypothetical protein
MQIKEEQHVVFVASVFFWKQSGLPKKLIGFWGFADLTAVAWKHITRQQRLGT